MHDRYMPLAEAARRLGLHRTNVIKLIESGQLTAIKASASRRAQYRISEQSVADFIDRHTVRPAAS